MSDSQDKSPDAGKTVDLPEDWWSTADVLTYLESVGAKIGRTTWATYVSRGQAPKPARHFGRSPVWRPQEIRGWQSSRRGQGWRGQQQRDSQ